LTFNEQKNIKKRKEIKDLEVQNCTRAIVHGRKVPDNDISKAKELENINKIEDREERWFELSAKIEG
jgi:ATP-binding cassette subfamily F protein uup